MRRQDTITLLLTLLSFTLLACGHAEDGAAAAGEPRDSASASAGILQLGEPRFGDFGTMVEERVIRVVTTFSRTGYFLDAGTPRGATYEGLMELEKFVNNRLGTGRLEVHVFVVPVARDQLLPALLEGRADIAAANLTVTPDRLEQVAFSSTVLDDVSEVIVTGPASPQLDRIEDLAGQDVYVRRSSSYYESLVRLSDELRRQGFGAIRIREVDELLETEDVMELVGAGALSMTVADSHLAGFWRDILDGVEIRADLAVATGRSIAWALRKDSPRLAEEVNAFIQGHRQGTLFGNIMLQRYLGENERVRNPLAGPELEKLRRYRGYFEEYASRYRLDWLLVAAQAYQESRFDHGLTSSAGAVGIMQIKPSTAADENVGIADISSVEDNIHAGVKYFRFIRDRYFKDSGPDDLNQDLFALAAYNAGPARVARFRQQAREKGLDPDVWFRHVEQMAHRETAVYVSNIFKYWVSYREYLRRTEAVEALKGG